MGQTLSEPVTEKHTSSGGNGLYYYAVSEMQGWRISMEDAHTTELELDQEGNAFFAVFDGHGGSSVAKYAGQRVHQRLVSESAYNEKNYETALKNAFMGIDDDLRADPAFFHDPSGCTAVAALLTKENRKIYVANAGDSRSVLSIQGEAKPLSFDHKPQNKTESARIQAAGGYIEYGRVNGNLALSRALGDFEFKQNYSLGPEHQIVTSNPDVTEHDLTEEDEFIILACDGIWDCLSSQAVIDIVRRQVADRKELTEIAESLMDRCTAPDSDIGGGIGCDNMTIVIVALLNGRTKEQWYDWMVDRVQNKHGYDTPTTFPQIYSPSRVRAAQERALSGHGMRGPSGLGALARVLGAGGVTFHPNPGGGISSEALFDQDDSDEYESGEDEMDLEHARAHGGAPSGFFGINHLRDPTTSLRAQLEELDDDATDHDGDSQMGNTGSNSPFSTRSTFIRPESDNLTPQIISPLSGPTSTGSPLIPTPIPLLAPDKAPSPPSSRDKGSPSPPPSQADAKPNEMVNGIKDSPASVPKSPVEKEHNTASHS